MGFNIREYSKGKARGIEIAYTILKKQGIEQLEKDIEFRLATAVDCDYTTDCINRDIENIKGVFFETALVMTLNVLRDEFDFGHVRLQRFYDSWMPKREEFLNKHIRDWFYWQRDTIERLKLTEFKIGENRKKVRRNDYENGRIAGMQLMLEKAKKDAKAEMKDIVDFRDPRKRGDGQIDKNIDRAYQRLQHLCYDTVLLIVSDTVHDLYKFGQERMDRFFQRWDLKTYCMEDGLVSWEDLVLVIQEEGKIAFEADYMVKRKILTC